MTATTTANLRARLTAVRARREALLRERLDLERRACAREEAHARVRAYLDAVARHIPVRLETAASWFAAPTAPEPAADLFAPQPHDRWLAAFLLDLCRPLVEARLDAAVDAIDWSAGIARADRVAEAGRIAQELAALEREEEQLARQLEQRGEDVDRRPDVNPAIVAASDADLPAV